MREATSPGDVLQSAPCQGQLVSRIEPCPVLGERVHAFVVVGGADLHPVELKRHCASLLADYNVPETFTLSNAPLPRNANGKLLKRNLRPQQAITG